MGAYASLEQNAVAVFGHRGSAAGATTGTGVDTQGYSEALVLLATGNMTGTLDVKIQDSADNSAWADVTGAAFAQIPNTGDGTLKQARLKLDGNLVRRYIRVSSTVEAALVAEHTVTFVLCGNQYNPQTVTPVAFTV